SATLTAKLGSVDLTAVSGYNVNAFHDSWDATGGFGGLTEFLFGVNGSPSFTNNWTNKFTQELRLSAPIGQRFDWLIGAFYTHEYSRYDVDYKAEDPATGQIVGDGLNASPDPSTYKEYAAFADLTFHITDRFDVQIGGRESKIEQTLASIF